MNNTQPQTQPIASADALFGQPSRRRYKYVDLPILQQRVRIRSLTERELARYNAAVMSNDGRASMRRARMEDATRRLFCLCLVDEAGDRLLADNDTHKFAGWDSVDSQILYDECSEWVGLRKGDIEDLVKNSEQIRVDG